MPSESPVPRPREKEELCRLSSPRAVTPATRRPAIGYYLTFGEYDFLVIAEMTNITEMAAAVLAPASIGGITDLHANVAMTALEAKCAFAAAGDLAPTFKSPGGA